MEAILTSASSYFGIVLERAKREEAVVIRREEVLS